ncbi:hypothetical protein [uncultured Imperialibacter sp.]|uniref:hypothetical protein n=1 Tax=uncultured Imperialibacter sp. TaxID=1672639 RepID=UPI0030DDCCA8|tara:strand:+ start:54945 stop:56033 length:1089 start_codon:yes stop_codon:yes gene_type:complete
MKRALFTLCILILSRLAISQSNGYIVKGDTAFIGGKIKFDRNSPNKVLFYTANKKSPIIYNADSLSEFGYKDSTRFVAKETRDSDKITRVFLEVLEEGELTLYKNGAMFFFEDQNQLTSLSKNDYLNYLADKSIRCAKWVDQHRLVKYNTKSLSHFARLYNQNSCLNIPSTSYGFIAGFGASSLFLGETAYPENTFGGYKINCKTLSLGVFYELPFWHSKRLSFFNQLQVAQETFIIELFSSTVNQDVKVELVNLQLIVAPKYEININRLTPFAYFGPTGMFNVKSKSEVFQARVQEKFIEFEKYNDSINIQKSLFGYCFGVGSEFHFSTSNYVSFEINNSMVYATRETNLRNLTLTLKANL